MKSSEASNLLSEEDVPCTMGSMCKASPENAGALAARCRICSLSPANEGVEGKLPVYWKPAVRGAVHPVVEARKREAGRDRRREAAVRRRSRDRARQERAQKAVRAEKATERSIIRATRNSGRALQDGDHVVADRYTLDTKMQSQRIHPVINLHELAKVRKDAARAGNLFGGLVLRPKNGIGIVALAEEDFARLISILMMREEANEREPKEPGSGERTDQGLPRAVPDQHGIQCRPAVQVHKPGS